MKKFLIVLFVVFVANLGCKKLDDGDRLCGCSPVSEPPLVLVIKGANGTDLLNPATTGYFAAENIKLYHISGGVEKPIPFRVGKPFSNGNTAEEKFEYYQIQSSLLSLASTTNQFYLKLGDGTPLLLKPTMDKDLKYKVAKLMVNDIEATSPAGYWEKVLPNAFYIMLP